MATTKVTKCEGEAGLDFGLILHTQENFWKRDKESSLSGKSGNPPNRERKIQTHNGLVTSAAAWRIKISGAPPFFSRVAVHASESAHVGSRTRGCCHLAEIARPQRYFDVL